MDEEERKRMEYWNSKTPGERMAATYEMSVAAWKAEHPGEELLSGLENRKVLKVIRNPQPSDW